MSVLWLWCRRALDLLPSALARGILILQRVRFRNSIIVTLRNSGRSMESARAHANAIRQRRRTPPPGVGEDTKEDAKGRRWP